MIPLLALVVFVPFLSIIALFLVPERHSFNVVLAATLLASALALAAVASGLGQGFAQLSFTLPYISSLGISLVFSLTQYSDIFVVMSAVVLLASAMAAGSFIKESRRIYNTLFLLVAGSAFGLFLSGNLVFFYLFFELSEVSMFFMIYIFGGYDRRYAAMKFLVYSIAASLALLIGVMVVYSGTAPNTFSIAGILSQSLSIPAGTQVLALALLLLAFLIKLPVFPFHGWMADAYTEAPTTGSMVLARILPQLGGYGLLLMFLMLPVASDYSIYIAALLGFSALYSALVAVKQVHIKRTIAYASMLDMGIASFGIAAIGTLGVQGGLYLMLSHGIAISLLFLVAGALDEAYGTLLISKLKGAIRNTPVLAYSFIFGSFATIGIPLTAGFVGELLVFSGAVHAFGRFGVVPLAAVLIMGAVLFWIIERSIMNSSKGTSPFAYPGRAILAAMLFLAASTIVLGILPGVLLAPFAA
jgi:NADH-quinone oxidoreductase subunit M